MIVEEAYEMPPVLLMHEARQQFAAAEIADDDWQAALYERGGWFMLLVCADRTFAEPYVERIGDLFNALVSEAV